MVMPTVLLVMMFLGLMVITMHLAVLPVNNSWNQMTKIIFGSLFRVGLGRVGNVIGFVTVGPMKREKSFHGIGAAVGLPMSICGIPAVVRDFQRGSKSCRG